ncbi:Zn-ribbon domain-containing OB-fold protein [Acuticoccus mangrovi]|uniref:OB-fold domain-containing protein n=1 Tax=Acuticoccus mangrovi TaxID=2796142 RepID=A0A934MHW6_9HYPH|nr:OB-fold domain-containing protein [Acuticoccus mangrovi]MBJ3778123.1 OB-fold domain-containing protein [Acuticoccus mangrovi]
MSDRIITKPRPRISPDNAPLFEGLRAGVLRLPFCLDCGKPHLPPGPVCPYCLSDRLEWRDASGLGTISSFVVVHKEWFPAFSADVPYNVIQVELDEGPRITARLDEDGPIAVGERVRADFARVDDDLTMLVFKRTNR